MGDGGVLKIKRVYEPKEPDDGSRLLVERLWPRGVSKADAAFDKWLKDLAPSDELRRWFSHEPSKWSEFKNKYLQELADPDKQEQLKNLAGISKKQNVTLVYSARDTEHNNALVLKEVVSNLEIQ